MDSDVIDDPDNPEWTEEDFANALGPEALPAEMLEAFPRTKARLARERASNKVLVSLRIDRDVIDRFKAGGAGWQTRINEALRKAAGGG